MGRYLIRVEGRLSSGLTSAFPSLHASQHAQTTLAGCLEDQSSLADVLKRLEDLGVDVVGVHRVPAREGYLSPEGERQPSSDGSLRTSMMTTPASSR
jgi:hypothetical protein